MGALLTVGTERLQLPDVGRPERMPSLPEWVASRAACLKPETQKDPTTGKWRRIMTLPANLILKAVEREEITRHVADLHALCGQTAERDHHAQEELLMLVTKIMMVLPSMTQNELSAEARGEAYMESLADLPVWAVRSAIRSWHKGDAGKKSNGEEYDYHWCPVPAELYSISRRLTFRVLDRAKSLQMLLDAEPLRECDEEHRRKMRGLFEGLSKKLKSAGR